MEAKELAMFLADALNEKKGVDILILDVEALVGYTSHLVIASGRSDRQVAAMADHLERSARSELGVRTLGTEGAREGLWALLDFGDVVVRDLESLWEDAPRVDYEPEGAEYSPGFLTALAH
ncbi:MAG: ribosome silencing factor [Phycisphaerales bacterium]|nr:ribosome silencing factor [Phycisphaerales bacterium]